MGENFTAIEKQCRTFSKISSGIIDEFLIYYAADDKKVKARMDKSFAEYRHISKQLPESFTRSAMAQYLAHCIFKENGLIGKFLKHSALKHITGEEKDLLEHHANHPWKFSFSTIVDMPHKDFYWMHDVFRDERFLLYSPGTTDTLRDSHIRLWFNLINFNGACWQSLGPIAGYQGYEPDDIFFFFAEKNPEVFEISEENLIADVEENPVPYMMLLSGSRMPLVYNKNDEIVFNNALFPVRSFSSDEIRKHFMLEYNAGIYKLSLKRWDKNPHFSVAYYNENKEEMLCTAMTDRGFEKLIDKFNQLGYPFDYDPEVRVHPTMLNIAEEILNREIVLNEYEGLFSAEPSEAETEESDKINHFLSLVIPELNAGENPDIQKMAQKAGIDLSVAQGLVSHVIDRLNKMK